ncbi:putative minor capsid protein [Bacillus cereus]|uniref:Minor capsid protein n=1 Tax=Bacillus cereus TaxID=1396 RepID=A0A9X7G9T5_BACCE|nr:putative minor capsid protein [Bacillus cereus]PED41964.1 minor capsid protein [Bacillus cereus]PFV11220.1 minor capsid protein [Bacillus cereus]
MIIKKDVPQLPKHWLIHRIEYHEYVEPSQFGGNESYKPSIVIEYVRVDLTISNTSNNTSEDVKYAGVIFIDVKNSENVPTNFVQKSKIVFEGRDYKLVNAKPCNSDIALHHWELEVI